MDDHSHLTKADMFSLGITVHELASCEPLPKNGARWQELRSGLAGRLPRYSKALNHLISRMMDPKAADRPSARKVVEFLEARKRKNNAKVAPTSRLAVVPPRSATFRGKTKEELQRDLQRVDKERELIVEYVML